MAGKSEKYNNFQFLLSEKVKRRLGNSVINKIKLFLSCFLSILISNNTNKLEIFNPRTHQFGK